MPEPQKIHTRKIPYGKEPMYYLACKYSGQEILAYRNNVKWCIELEVIRGLPIYSPIRDSHLFSGELKKVNMEQPHDWWIKRDLRICERFLNHDAYGMNHQAFFTHNNDGTINPNKFDTGLVMLFSDDCFKKEYGQITHDFDSEGAEMEYEWANKKENKVRCLRLEAFIDGREIEI